MQSEVEFKLSNPLIQFHPFQLPLSVLLSSPSPPSLLLASYFTVGVL